MILSDKTLMKLISDRTLIVDSIESEQIQPASIAAIELTAGRRVGQLVFAKLDDNALNPYCGKYQGQKGATGSKVYLDKK